MSSDNLLEFVELSDEALATAAGGAKSKRPPKPKGGGNWVWFDGDGDGKEEWCLMQVYDPREKKKKGGKGKTQPNTNAAR
jgi:hypothetical protein